MEETRVFIVSVVRRKKAFGYIVGFFSGLVNVNVSCGWLFLCARFGGCMADNRSIGDNFIGSGEFLDEFLNFRNVNFFNLFGIWEICDLLRQLRKWKRNTLDLWSRSWKPVVSRVHSSRRGLASRIWTLRTSYLPVLSSAPGVIYRRFTFESARMNCIVESTSWGSWETVIVIRGWSGTWRRFAVSGVSLYKFRRWGVRPTA